MAYNDHIKSQEDLNRDAARHARESEERLAKQFEIKDGKWLGFIPIPAPLRRFLGPAINVFTTKIATSAGEYAGKQTVKLLGSSVFEGKFTESAKLLAAKRVNTSVLGLTLGMDLVLGMYAITKERASTYLTLLHDTKAMADEVGADAKNPIIGLAFKKYHQSWGDDIKVLVPSVIKFASTIPYAAQRYGDIWPESEWAKTWAGGSHTTEVVKATSSSKPTREQLRQQAMSSASGSGGKFNKSKYEAIYSDLLDEHGYSGHTPSRSSSTSHHNNQQQPHDPLELLMNLFTDKWRTSVPVLAGFFEPDLEDWATKKNTKKQNTSLELIEELRERVKAGSTGHIHQDVIRIFEQFEKDVGHKEFASPLLTERTEAIAKAIVDGKLPVRGLIRLVGEDMVVSHAGGNRELKSEEEIEKSLHLVAASTISRENEVSKEKFLGRYERSAIIEDTIRKNLSEFKEGPERDFFIALMPLEILENTGLTKKEIREHRARAQEHIYENVAAAVLHLALHEEKYLKEHGLKFKEIQYLKGISERVLTGDMTMLRELVENKKEGLTTLVAAGLMAEQADRVTGDSKIWTELVDNKSLEERIATIKAAQGPEAPESEREMHSAEDGRTDEKSHVARVDKSHRGRSKGYAEHHARSTAGEPSLHQGF